MGNKEFFMKNAKTLLAILTTTLILTLTLVSCKDGGGGGGNFQIKVVNENDKTITKVESLGIIWSVDCNITTGKSQTFPVDGLEGNYDMGVWYGEPSTKASNHIHTDKGQTTTITLTADGKLTSDKKGGSYTD